MRIILVAAVSNDWFIADQDGSVKAWTSPEDGLFFRNMLAKHPFGIMGLTTYKKNFQTSTNADHMRLVLTHSPQAYEQQSQPGVLEFRTLEPATIAQVLDLYDTYATCLVLGGTQVYDMFLNAGIVDEIFLTQEPIELESGTPFTRSPQVLLEILSEYEVTTERLNSNGTVLHHFQK